LLYHANISGNGYCTSIINTTSIAISNVLPILDTGTEIIGSQSGTMAIINTVKRNGITKFFDTFIQMHKYDATLVSGTFLNNEVVAQGNNTGFIHHVEGSTNITVFLTNMSKIFQANSTNIIGQTSGAIATLTQAYTQEVVPLSGEVQYLENLEPVTRANTQSESFQIVMNF
jgi:hypothetical protein